MDEFVEKKEKAKHTFIDHAVRMFEQDFCEKQDFVPVDGGLTLEQLEKDPEAFEGRSFTKEEIEGFIKAEAERAGQGDYDHCSPLFNMGNCIKESIGDI